MPGVVFIFINANKTLDLCKRAIYFNYVMKKNNLTREKKMKSTSEIREDAKGHKGMQFSAETFRWAFGLSGVECMKIINELVLDGTLKIVGTYLTTGLNKYEIA